MRFSCQVEVYNRLCGSTAQAQSRRQKSTITVGGYGHSQVGGKLWILHQTVQNGSGVRYKVNSNVTSLFSKFLHEGKATVRFRDPAVDLRIIADPLQLGKFVELITNFCTGKSQDPTRKIKLTNLADVSNKVDAPPPKKLVVTTVQQFQSLKGSYPSSLEHLRITNVGIDYVDPKIFRLQHLRVLNLEGNNISRIPKSIDLLAGLTEINLAGNRLGSSLQAQDWDWLTCESLQSSLTLLNLSKNGILVLPNRLPLLGALKTLVLDNNNLTKLPNNIGLLKSLRNLSLSGNSLSWLPATILYAHLERLDISKNNFTQTDDIVIVDDFKVSTLKSAAGRAVLMHRLQYDDISLPRELIRFLESACFCLCSKATFPSAPSIFKLVQAKSLVADTVVYDISLPFAVAIGYRKCFHPCSLRMSRSS